MFRCFRNARGLLLLLGVVLIAAYLVIWHGQHLAAALPVLLLLACPFMHLLMDGGHGGHGRHRTTPDRPPGDVAPRNGSPEESA